MNKSLAQHHGPKKFKRGLTPLEDLENSTLNLSVESRMLLSDHDQDHRIEKEANNSGNCVSSTVGSKD